MASLLIAVGSVYGGALEVAELAQQAAQQQGFQVLLSETPRLAELAEADSLLVVTSTTGSGERPEGLESFYQALQSQPSAVLGKSFAVVALGDSSYGDSYCAAGRAFDELLQSLGSQALITRLEIDALEHFQATEGAEEWIAAWLQALNEKG